MNKKRRRRVFIYYILGEPIPLSKFLAKKKGRSISL
jgi:hypothetical protein